MPVNEPCGCFVGALRPADLLEQLARRPVIIRPGTDYRAVGIFLRKREAFLKPPGLRPVVGILTGDPFPARNGAPADQRPRQPCILLGQNSNPSVSACEFFDQSARSVVRPIVDDHEFKVLERLIEDALDGSGDGCAGVPDAHHDRNGRR